MTIVWSRGANGVTKLDSNRKVCITGFILALWIPYVGNDVVPGELVEVCILDEMPDEMPIVGIK